MNNQLLLKRLSIIDFITVIIAYIIVLTTDPARGYELNIYATYSSFFWILFFFGIILSVIILSLSELWEISNYWKTALLLTIILYSIFLLLPLFRGYYFFSRGSCDVFAHLSWTQYILNTGTITSYYPISHILLTGFHFAGLNLEIGAQIFPVLFTILLILFLSILGRSLCEGPWISLLPILFSLPLLYGTFHRTFHPFIYALFFFPLFFYLLFKSFNQPEMKQYPFLLIIISFFICFMHPLITLLLIVFTLIIYTVNNYIVIREQERKRWNHLLIFISTILGISFCVWYLSFWQTLTSIRKIFFALLDNTDSAVTILGFQLQMVTTSDVHLFHIAKLFLLNYGPIFSYLILGLLLCIFIVIKARDKKINDVHLIFCALFLVGFLFSGIFLVGNFIIFEPIRAAASAIIFAMIFIPYVLIGILKGLNLIRLKNIFFLTFTIFLIIIISISCINIFSSPIISTNSWHMSYMERDGLNWFLDSRNDKIPVVLFIRSLSYEKYEMYYSERNDPYSSSTKDRIRYIKVIPTHFGYDTNKNLAETLDTNEYYFLSTELNRQQDLAVPEDWREWLPKLTPADFLRLKEDDSINLLYSNGEFESWWIPSSVSRNVY